MRLSYHVRRDIATKSYIRCTYREKQQDDNVSTTTSENPIDDNNVTRQSSNRL